MDHRRFALRRHEAGAACPDTEILTDIDNATLLNEAGGYEMHRIPNKVRDPSAKQSPEA